MKTRMEKQELCPLCCGQAKFQVGNPFNRFDCEVCGEFGMTHQLLVDRDMKGEPHPYLSAATRKANGSGSFLRLRLRANACLTRSFWPGFK